MQSTALSIVMFTEPFCETLQDWPSCKFSELILELDPDRAPWAPCSPCAPRFPAAPCSPEAPYDLLGT